MAQSHLALTTVLAALAAAACEHGQSASSSQKGSSGAVSKPLPLGVPVSVTFTPSAPGPIRYACAMDMVAGELVAE